jgi:formylglycine-generating enzyme required for sulfatase activity
VSARAAQAGHQRAWASRLVLLALPLLCRGQATDQAPNPRPAATGAPAVEFRALDYHDRREALADLLHRLALERDSRREEHRAYIDAVGNAQALPAQPDDDQKLRSALVLAANLNGLDERLKESRLRRLGILDFIQSQATQTGPASTEGASILREADAEVRLMLSQQAEQARRMALLRRQLEAFVNAVPAPAEFAAASGVVMRRVGVGDAAFYASVAPLPVSLYRRFVQSLPPTPELDAWQTYAAGTGPEAALSGVSWYEAWRLCQWLSAQDGVAYRLPTAAEAAVIMSTYPKTAPAFWGGEIWTPEGHAARRDLKRFGVDLVTVWDPNAVLATKPGGFGEVPFARYPSLTVYVVATRQAGVAQRWQRLKTPAP